MKFRSVSLRLLATMLLGAAATAAPLLPPVINSPGNLVAPGPSLGTSSPTFTWNAVGGATGYGLYIVDLTDNVVVYPNLSGMLTTLTNSPFTLPGGYLPGAKSFAWAMSTFSGGIESAQSPRRYFQTPASSLQPPPATAGTPVGVTSFVANWRTVFGLTNYVVDVSSSSTFSSFINGGLNIQAGSNTSITISGLDSGTTYYYRVRAYDAVNTSGNSTTIAVTTLPTALPAPNPGAASFVTTNSFRANWGPVVIATGYRVDVSTNSNFQTFIRGGQDLDVGNTLFVTISGLTNTTTYYYRVRAYNGSGTSGASSVVTVATVSLAPGTPVAIAASSVTGTNFVANWNTASNATGYLLDVSTNTTFANFVSGYQNLDVGDVTNATAAGLKHGTTYYYRLRARNASGAGTNSNVISVRTEPPILVATPQAANLVFSWPTNNPAYKLFYTTNLPPTAWISNTVPATVVAGSYRLTVSPTNKARFYRLKE